MKNRRLWGFAIVCLLTASAYAKDYKYWINLESSDTECFQYGSIPTSAVQGDLDNDGVMDVAVGTYVVVGTELGKCFILWGGTTYDEIGTTTDFFDLIAIEDLDDNGYKDIICLQGVFFNHGNRKFTYDNSTRYSLSSKFVDLNNDGKVDIVTGGYWRNGSDGTQQDLNIRYDYFDIIDMNNDGRLDLIGDRWDNPKYFWYENTDDDPLFGDANIIIEKDIVPCGVIDYDYDGDDDLFVINDGAMGFLVNNDGLLPLDYEPLFDAVPVGFRVSMGHKLVDIDLDGDWDMFGYNGTEKRFFAVEQIGYRTLQYKFHWISDKMSLNHWAGYLIYQSNKELYYYFKISSGVGPTARGGFYRTPILVQKENAVSCNWEIFE